MVAHGNSRFAACVAPTVGYLDERRHARPVVSTLMTAFTFQVPVLHVRSCETWCFSTGIHAQLFLSERAFPA